MGFAPEIQWPTSQPPSISGYTPYMALKAITSELRVCVDDGGGGNCKRRKSARRARKVVHKFTANWRIHYVLKDKRLDLLLI